MIASQGSSGYAAMIGPAIPPVSKSLVTERSARAVPARALAAASPPRRMADATVKSTCGERRRSNASAMKLAPSAYMT